MSRILARLAKSCYYPEFLIETQTFNLAYTSNMISKHALGICADWKKGTSMRKKNLPLRPAVMHFLNYWLLGDGSVHCVCFRPCAGGPRFSKKERAKFEEQANKQHPPWTVYAPSSGFPPTLSSFPDFLQWRTTMWMCKPSNPFLSQSNSNTVFHRSNRP